MRRLCIALCLLFTACPHYGDAPSGDAGLDAAMTPSDAATPIDANIDGGPCGTGTTCIDAPTGCPGVPPADLTSCFQGAAFADCGGVGPSPVLACDYRQCLWFTGGCFPTGWIGSTCAAANVCCNASTPFGPGVIGPGSDRLEQLMRWGSAPWDRVRETNVDVAVGAVGAASPLACSWEPAPVPPRGPGAGPEDPCLGPTIWNAGLPGSLVLFTSDPYGLSGWRLFVEAFRASDGTMRARACQIHFTDAFSMTHECTSGPTATGPQCATSGTLTLSAWPAMADTVSIHASMHLDFGSGETVDATF